VTCVGVVSAFPTGISGGLDTPETALIFQYAGNKLVIP
jgi:hypothetical protein